MEIVSEILLKVGVPVNIGDENGNTPLHWAVRLGNERMVRFLLENQADANALNVAGDTPRVIAEKSNRHLVPLFRTSERDEEEMDESDDVPNSTTTESTGESKSIESERKGELKPRDTSISHPVFRGAVATVLNFDIREISNELISLF
jgi:hypothetical protein